MHELGLLRAVVTAVEDTAAGQRVEAIGLRVGSLSGALPEALEGAWPIASAGTVLEGSRLDIETVQAAVHCPACNRDQPVDEFFALRCPECDTPTANLVRGREFQVVWADLADDPNLNPQTHHDSHDSSTPTA